MGVIAAYLLMAIGLCAANHLVPKVQAPEDSIAVDSKEPHKIQLLDRGVDSFGERIKLVRAAKKSIEVEYFIYNVDKSSRIFTQELIKKAKEGVKVRVLVDFSTPVFQLRPVYAHYMKEHGIDVRYYNTSGLYRFVSMQHRSHRKLLLADGEAVITGGRNIGDEYFDLAPEYNFLDTDIILKGPVVAQIERSFDLYWNSELSQAPDEKEFGEKDQSKVEEFFQIREADTKLLADVLSLAGENSNSANEYDCRDISFETDFPNQGENNRRVFQAIVKEMQTATASVVAESPYFVIKKGGYEVIKELNKRGVALKFLTNGLVSTDAFYTVASLFYNARWLAETGMTLYTYKGQGIQGVSTNQLGAGDRWGIHSKRAVIDEKTVMVGTYNIDPRSANLNSELLIVCRNQPEFAKEVLHEIERRMQFASPAIQNGNADRSAILQDSTLKQKLMFALFFPVSNLFDFLL